MTSRALVIFSLAFIGSARADDIHPWSAVTPIEPKNFGPVPRRYSSGVNGVLVSPDGRWFVGRSYSTLQVWNLRTGEPIVRSNPTYYAANAFFSPDPNVLFASTSGQGLVTLDLATGDACPLFEGEPQERMALLAASRDGRRVLMNVGGNSRNYESRSRIRMTDSWLAVRDTKTGEYLARIFDPSDPIRPATLSPDGKWLATVGGQGTIKLWDASTGRELRTLREGNPPPTPNRRGSSASASIVVAFSPDSRLLATIGGVGNTYLPMTLWSVPDGVRRVWWDASADMPGLPFAFAPDNRSIFAGGQREPFTLRQYDLATGAPGQKYRGHVGPVRSVAVTADGQTLVTGGDDGTIRVWDVADGSERFPHHGHIGDVSVLAFGPRGEWFASGGADGTVRVRDPRTGADLVVPLQPASAGAITTLAADLTGTRLAIGSINGSVRLWDWATSELKELPTTKSWLGGNVQQVRFDPDGRGLSAVAMGNHLIRWLLPSGEPVIIPSTTVVQSTNFFLLGRTPLSLVNEYRNNEQRIALYDVLTGMLRVEKKLGERERLDNLGLTPDGKWLMGMPEWSDNRIVQFRDSATLTVRFRLPVVDHGDRSPSRYSPDGRFVLFDDPSGKACVIELATGGLIARLESDELAISSLALAPDASRVVGVRSDGLFASFALRPQPTTGPLTGSELAKYWTDLLATDPRVALAAIDRLAADPDRAVPFLRDRLRPAEPLGEDEWKKLVADLDGPRFAVRQAAAARLTEVATRQADDLKAVLRDTTSAEVRRAVDRILKESADAKYRPRGESLRHLRAVCALEWAGTKESAATLRALATGPSGAILTIEAEAAVHRIRP